MSFPAYLQYKDSGVEWQGAVPAEWPRSALKYLADYQNGYPFKPEDWGEEGLPIIRISQLTGDTAPNYYSGELDCRVKVGDGDLLFSWSATIDSFIWSGGAAWLNQHIFKVSPTFEADQKFLFYLIKLVAPKLADFDAHGSTMRHIKKESLSERLHVPTLAEQTQIARFLDHETARIDALIEEQQRLIELLKEKRQAVISHAVTKGLDPTVPMKDSGVEWLGEVPAHWVKKRLKNISPFITVGIVVNPSDYVADEGLPFLYGGEVKEGFIEVDKARKISPEHSRQNRKTMLEADDIVTMRVGYPGLTAVVPPECAGGNCASVMLVKRGNYDSQWLCAVMNSRLVRQQVEVVQYGAAQKQFNIADAIEFWMFEPPIEEQTMIAEFIDGQSSVFNTLMEESERSMLLLKERRSALISAAVTGKIDVRGWQPPASAKAPEHTIQMTA